MDAIGKECFGYVGGLGIRAAIHYYREFAKAHDALHVPMHLVMVHADMSRMVRWAEAGEARSIAQHAAGLLLFISEMRPISPLPLVKLLEIFDDSVRAKGFRRVLCLEPGSPWKARCSAH